MLSGVGEEKRINLKMESTIEFFVVWNMFNILTVIIMTNSNNRTVQTVTQNVLIQTHIFVIVVVRKCIHLLKTEKLQWMNLNESKLIFKEIYFLKVKKF